jgi:hypothetical protein
VFIAASSLLALAGVAVASAVSSSNNSGTSAAPATSPTVASSTPAVTHPATPKPAATKTATKTATKPKPRPAAVTEVHPSLSATPTPSPTRNGCPSVGDRVLRARAHLSHPAVADRIAVHSESARAGTLATADYSARTVTLFVRSCAQESLTQLAVAWMYETGQFVAVEKWDASTQAQWRQLRGTSSLATTAQLRQDVAAVFAYWQTGTTQFWQSPVPPPSSGQLPALARFLRIS